MSEAERALAALAAAIAAEDGVALARAVDRAAAACDAGAVEESLLQSHLFVGFPRALEALAVWRQRSGVPAPESLAEEDGRDVAVRGQAVCATVYGGEYERLRANVKRLHPAYERWMVEDGYGKVLGRAGLSLRVRELCIVAQLAAFGAPRQLYSHLRGALNAGATDADVEAALAEAAVVSRPVRIDEARAVWAMVQSRGREG